jgi:hypothetical protein
VGVKEAWVTQDVVAPQADLAWFVLVLAEGMVQG